MPKWDAHEYETAKRVLATCFTVGEAAAMLELELGRKITPDAITNAFRRRGDNASKYLSGWSEPPPAVAKEKAWDQEDELAWEPLPIPASGSGPTAEKTYLVTNDNHYPYHDPECEAVARAIGRDLKPTGLVINGDWLDLFEISSHNKGSAGKLENRRVSETYAQGDAGIERYLNDLGCDNGENYFNFGNHEDRLRRWLMTGDNIVWLGDDAVNIPKRLKLRERGFIVQEDPMGQACRLGHLLIIHGHLTNEHHAKKMLYKYGHSVMYGHTHTHQVFMASALGTKRISMSIGYMGLRSAIAFDYASEPDTWVHQIAAVSVRPSGVFNIDPITIWQGVAFFGGRKYSSPLALKKEAA